MKNAAPNDIPNLGFPCPDDKLFAQYTADPLPVVGFDEVVQFLPHLLLLPLLPLIQKIDDKDYY